MPVHKVGSKWQWGQHGKLYSTKAQAVKQGQAAHAAGYKEKHALRSDQNAMDHKYDHHDPQTWLMDDAELLDAMDALIQTVELNTDYDVPFTAGYSIDGQTIYVDRDLPETMSGGVEVIPFVVIHEIIESSLENEHGITYLFAHQIALRIEQACVEAAGVSWDDYNTFMMKEIPLIQSKQNPQLPPDLNMDPESEQ